MLNGGFMRRGQLLDNVGVMAEHGHIVAICHGRADYVCQPQAAWRLAQAARPWRPSSSSLAGAG